MMIRKFLTGVALLLAIPAYAHHSLPAAYDVTQTITVEGVVTQFHLRSPHSFIFVEVQADDEEVETWAVEWGNTVGMARAGYDKDTILPGDRIIVTGEPARDTERKWVHLVTLHRPADDFKVGFGPRTFRGAESTGARPLTE